MKHLLFGCLALSMLIASAGHSLTFVLGVACLVAALSLLANPRRTPLIGISMASLVCLPLLLRWVSP